MSTKLRSLRIHATIAALVLAMSNGLAAAPQPNTAAETSRAERSVATYRGGLVTPPLAKPQFTLTDTSGAPFNFRVGTEGYVTLLFFGYTHCPDECPLHMAAIATSLQQISPEVRNQVKVVFVTADPARDTPAVVRAWLNHFDRKFIGLTGDAATIEAAQRAAQIPVATKTMPASKAYDVGHAAFVLAYTKDNLAHVIYPGGVTPTDWAHDLPLLVNEQWASQ
jgi:protein SCO1/2